MSAHRGIASDTDSSVIYRDREGICTSTGAEIFVNVNLRNFITDELVGTTLLSRDEIDQI